LITVKNKTHALIAGGKKNWARLLQIFMRNEGLFSSSRGKLYKQWSFKT